MHGEDIAPVLQSSCCLAPSQRRELAFQVKPFALDVQTMNKPEFPMDHRFRMIRPHVVPAVICESACVLSEIYVYTVHVRDDCRARQYVFLTDVKDVLTIFLFNEVHHTQFGLTAVQAENPTDLRKILDAIEFTKADIGLIHVDD